MAPQARIRYSFKSKAVLQRQLRCYDCQIVKIIRQRADQGQSGQRRQRRRRRSAKLCSSDNEILGTSRQHHRTKTYYPKSRSKVIVPAQSSKKLTLRSTSRSWSSTLVRNSRPRTPRYRQSIMIIPRHGSYMPAAYRRRKAQKRYV